MWKYIYSWFANSECKVVAPKGTPYKTISLAEAERILRHDTHGCIFHVKFKTRTDGSIREMQCRRHITSHLHGGVLPYNADEKRLTVVFDVYTQEYRTICWEGILQIRKGGIIYNVKGDM